MGVVSGMGRRGRKLWGVARVPEYWPALVHGVAASCEHHAVDYPHDYATILDVGANRGQFALFARRRFPEATLLSFEPLVKPRRLLRRVMRGHRAHLVYDVALTERTGEAHLNVARDDDMSSLLEPTPVQLRAFPASRPIARVKVRAARLDDELANVIMKRPVLLKIDVQGAELDVLRGAERRLSDIDSVVVESSFVELFEGGALAGDVTAFLHERGFRLASISSPTFDRDDRCLQAELLFERRETLANRSGAAPMAALHEPVRPRSRLRLLR